MLKRLRNAHPVLFCILVEVLFLGSLFVSDLVFTFVLLFARADFSALDGYLYSGLQELVGTLVVVLVLQKTGRLGAAAAARQRLFQRLAGGHVPAGDDRIQHLRRADVRAS